MALWFCLPYAQPHEPVGVAPGRVDGQIQQLSTESATVVGHPDVELLDLKPCFEAGLGLRATPVQLQVADRLATVEDPRGVGVRVRELRGDDVDGERALDVRGELGGIVAAGEALAKVSAFRTASCSASPAEGVANT